MNQEKDGKRGFHLIHNKPNKSETIELIQLGELKVDFQKFLSENGSKTFLYCFKAVNGK